MALHMHYCWERTARHIILTLTIGGDFGGIDFSKLGGAGGMPDLSAMGMGGEGEGEGEDEDSGDDDDDEEVPGLEGEEAKKA